MQMAEEYGWAIKGGAVVLLRLIRFPCAIVRFSYELLLLLSLGLPVANAPNVLQPCGLLYYS